MTPRALTAAEWDIWHVCMEAQRVLTAEIDSSLQAEVGISKAEFSILVTLRNAPESTLRVGLLATTLRWEKSRVSHMLSRMEGRNFVERIEDGAPGRRTAVSLSRDGHRVAEIAIEVHAGNVHRLFFDRLTPVQAGAILDWSQHLIDSTLPAESTVRGPARPT
jgi:DNA-binding MarR family transcriptional regulator